MFDFGMRLQELRKKNNLSLSAMSKKIGRSKSVICGYENNYKTPPIDILVKIAVLFNVSLDYLVGIDKDEAPSLSGMTPQQKELVNSLITELKKGHIINPDFTTNEQAVLNRVIQEFNNLRK